MRRTRRYVQPTVAQVQEELDRSRKRIQFASVVRSTIYILITVAAAAILIATLLLPVLRIYGSSMVPTLSEGEIVVSLKGSSFEQGDIVAFYYNNKILVKRVICGPGDWVNFKEDGTVLVNGNVIDEPYIQEPDIGICDIELPYQVPEGSFFVMGDLRATSVDSRSSSLGCVPRDQIVGRIIFRVWPLNELGTVE